MKHLIIPILFALFLPLTGCATSYSAAPIKARIVDADTQQPIQDVVVVAHWQLEGGLEGGNNVGQMMVLEAVTDADGYFSFPAWGPKPMPTGLAEWHANARLKDMDPEILPFKSGYAFLRLFNERTMSQMSMAFPYYRTSDWNGKTIKLKKFTGSLKEYARHLDRGGDGLNDRLKAAAASGYCTGSGPDNGCTGRGLCEWKNIPKMIDAVGKQTKIFRDAGIRDSTFYSSLTTSEEFFQNNGCGSVKAFLKEHEIEG